MGIKDCDECGGKMKSVMALAVVKSINSCDRVQKEKRQRNYL